MTIYTNKELPDRRSNDHYPTPRWAVEKALGLVELDFACDGRAPRAILDLGAGEGIWGEVARERWPAATIVGVELRTLETHPAYTDWITGSFPEVAADVGGPFDLIMGNPPFGAVEPMIAASWPLLTPPAAELGRPTGRWWRGGRLALFLRLAFLEGQKRRDGLYREHPLKRLGVYSKRVSFQSDGKTNATAHGLFLWQLGSVGAGSIYHF